MTLNHILTSEVGVVVVSVVIHVTGDLAQQHNVSDDDTDGDERADDEGDQVNLRPIDSLRYEGTYFERETEEQACNIPALSIGVCGVSVLRPTNNPQTAVEPP
jgi:hypothetical protein